MPRPPRFTDDDILDAALACVARRGAETSIAEVATELDGPVGSIYHRFTSRDELLIRLWLRSIHRFQSGLFDIAERARPGLAALTESALHVPRYCRSHPDEARALTLYRHSRLLVDCPPQLRDQVTNLNDDLMAHSRRLTREHFGSANRRALELTELATRVCPYGLVRPFLGRPVPPAVDEAVQASALAILTLPAKPSVNDRAAR